MPEEIVFKEGQKFQFIISNKLNLPGTDEANWILIGPDQKKYLLPAEYYTNYNLKIGQQIQCLVDKINCSGKIFLEPDHPYYKIGERYDFLVLRISEQENFLGKDQYIAWVQDLHGLEWPCPVDKAEGIEPGYSHLACRVDRIRKAELILSLPAMTTRFITLKTGQNYLFRILDIRTFENQQFYILKDSIGNLHRLSVTDYDHYRMKQGEDIEATVVKYKPNGECVIEPVHPYYRIGESYPFRFVRLEKTIDLFGRIEAVIFVEDIYNQSIKVKPQDWQIEAENYHPEENQCRVQRFKKGKPVLVNVEKLHDQDIGSQQVNTN
jgi:hypothetical protein